jgi:hypothetical protein
MATLQSLMAEIEKRRNDARQLTQTRDERRGYGYIRKLVVLAFLGEAVIITTSLYGAWIFANFYGHGDWRQMHMMMLAPIGYAVIEFFRVPLALSVRTHPTKWIRTLAFIGVIAVCGVTVKSVSQLGEIMFRPRLFDVVHAEEAMDQAKATQASIDQQIKTADDAVVGYQQAFHDSQERLDSVNRQLAALPKDQCHAISGVTKDGRPWQSQTCKSDPRIKPMQDNLNTLIGDSNAHFNRLDDAKKVRAQIDRAAIDHDVATTQGTYREAILQSQLHSLTGMLFAKSSTEVTNQEIHQFLRIFVLFPAVFVAISSTLIAFTAVYRIEIPPPTLIPFPLEGDDYLRSVVNETVQRSTKGTRS